MSGGICVNFPERDINFILPVQNIRTFNQTSQILYPRNSFPDSVLGFKCIFRSNEKMIIIFVGTKIYGVVHILAYRNMHVTHFGIDIISNLGLPFHLISYLSYTKIKRENNLTSDNLSDMSNTWFK